MVCHDSISKSLIWIDFQDRYLHYRKEPFYRNLTAAYTAATTTTADSSPTYPLAHVGMLRESAPGCIGEEQVRLYSCMGSSTWNGQDRAKTINWFVQEFAARYPFSLAMYEAAYSGVGLSYFAEEGFLQYEFRHRPQFTLLWIAAVSDGLSRCAILVRHLSRGYKEAYQDARGPN